jgi:hypothetical protein
MIMCWERTNKIILMIRYIILQYFYCGREIYKVECWPLWRRNTRPRLHWAACDSSLIDWVFYNFASSFSWVRKLPSKMIMFSLNRTSTGYFHKRPNFSAKDNSREKPIFHHYHPYKQKSSFRLPSPLACSVTCVYAKKQMLNRVSLSPSYTTLASCTTG